MKCPKCDTALGKVKIRIRPEYGADILNDAGQTSEIEIDQCLSCNGVWFDVKELDQYLSEKLLILESKKPVPKSAGFTVDTESATVFGSTRRKSTGWKGHTRKKRLPYASFSGLPQVLTALRIDERL